MSWHTLGTLQNGPFWLRSAIPGLPLGSAQLGGTLALRKEGQIPGGDCKKWEQRKKHNLLKVQKLYGKLLHTALVIPAGQAHLTSLEAMLTICSNSPFILCSPPRDMPDNLEWWKAQLHKPTISKAQDGKHGGLWQYGRPEDGTSSGLRQSALNFLSSVYVQYLREGSTSRFMGTIRDSSRGGEKDPVATSQPTRYFTVILQLSKDSCQTIHTRYIPSKQNPTDAPSWGQYPPTDLLLPTLPMPLELKPFLINTHL